jgi:aryl-alcohol dehydrogenase
MQVAAVVERASPFALLEAEIPEPGPGEIRVAVKATGICHTDLVFRDLELGTPLPMVLGHEGAGVIDAIGEGVEGFAPGDRVALSYDSCGACPVCREGAPQYCEQWPLLNIAGVGPDMAPRLRLASGQPLFASFFGQSSFAPYAITRARNTVPIPDALPFHLAAPLGCGMQTGAGAVLNTLAARPGQSLAVLGAGAVGLAAVMAARVAGMDPIVAVDRVPARLDLARSLGATHGLLSGATPAADLAAIRPGFDAVLDTTGVPALIELGIAALGARGAMLVLAVAPPGATASFALSGFLGGKRIQGLIEGDADPQDFVPRLAALHLEGRFPHDRLVETFPFAEINRAAHAMESGTTVKPVLLFGD